MDILTIVGGIVILFIVLNLRGRIQKLEQFMIGGAIQRPPDLNYQPQPQQPINQSPPLDFIKQQDREGTGPSITPTVQAGPTAMDRFGAWLKEDWLLKLGALLLLIGFGWLTTYAFMNNWIGPMGRIVLGIFAGAAFILLGWWRINKYIHQGGIFLVMGSTIILITIFAAREIYNFFNPTTALIVMFLSTALVALASVKYKSRPLALSSIILAGIAPLLTNAPTTDYVALFTYLFVVILGTVWIVVLTGRRELTIAALALVVLYSLPHLFSFMYTYSDTGTLLLFAYAFATVFFLTNTAGLLRLKDKEIMPDVLAAVGNGLFLLAWIIVAAPREWQSLIISTWMVVFLLGAFVIYRITQRREPFYVYAGVGVAMLAAATSAELSGATLTIAYTIESGLVALIAYLVLRDTGIAARISFLLVGPVVLSIGSLTSHAWTRGVMHKDFFVLLVLGVTLLGLGLFFLQRARIDDDKRSRQPTLILLIIGSIYFFVLLWLSLHALLHDKNTAVMLSLVAYTIVGLASYFYGLANDKKNLQLYGGVLVGFVVGRLLLVDIWTMELAGKIVTFFLIGTLLVSTAFFGKKKRDLGIPTNIQ